MELGCHLGPGTLRFLFFKSGGSLRNLLQFFLSYGGSLVDPGSGRTVLKPGVGQYFDLSIPHFYLCISLLFKTRSLD